MKKNLRKIPDEILSKIKTIKGKNIVVGCAVKFKANDLIEGRLRHLGIVLTPEGLQLPSHILPPRGRGNFTSWNIDGKTVVRTDLPKEIYYQSMEVPNWGGYGTHTVRIKREKYPRQFRPPALLEISINCKDVQPGLPAYAIAFQVVDVLDKTAITFKDRLFANLNLLQENVGSCGVESTEVLLADYVKSLHLSWEILPPGTLDDTINRLFRDKTPTKEDKDVATERYKFFTSFKPKQLIYGNSGFRRYFGALLEDNLVLFENVQYGNAVYILFGEWEKLSKLSRIDLLSGQFGEDFERVTHVPGWQNEVKAIVSKRRNGDNSLF
jgi:hypothetical protein